MLMPQRWGPVKRGPLGISRRASCREDRGEAASARRNGAGTGKLQQPASIEARHDLSSLQPQALRLALS